MSRPPIMAATDLSEPANEAIREGSEWARLRGADLIVCHVVPSLVGSHMLFPQLIEKEAIEQPVLEARVAELVRERTSTVTGRDPEDFKVVIAEGKAYAEILRQAEALGVGLIVVGGHGRSGLASVFLGNVAEQVVRHASTSVLLARPHRKSGRLVVATDFSDVAFAALLAAAEQARLTGGRITLMCSIRERLEPVLAMATLGTTYNFVQEEHDEVRKNAERELQALLERAGVAGDTVVTEGDPAAELVHLAAELVAELAVVGATGRTALRRLLLGNVAEKVTRHAPCSVLVVRAPLGRGGNA
ncbi:MAG: Universal stress protein family [bacterium]|nr:Universal stress protein family [bacterium]